MISIRPEQSEDVEAIRDINLRAFGGSDEADLVDRIRVSCSDAISLIARNNDQLVGHIFFSPVVLSNAEHNLSGMGLAPMAVIPEHQRRGIGSMLVESGLEILRADRVPFVVVLGHPQYYPRFGFEPASTYHLTCEFDVPDEFFMVRVMNRNAGCLSGVAKYHREFDAYK